MHRLIIKAELFQRLVAKAGDHDVGVSQEPLQESHAFWVFQVHRKEFLVQRGQIERWVVNLGFIHAESGSVGAILIARERFDFVHGGAHFAQYAQACRCGNVAGKLDDLYSL